MGITTPSRKVVTPITTHPVFKVRPDTKSGGSRRTHAPETRKPPPILPEEASSFSGVPLNQLSATSGVSEYHDNDKVVMVSSLKLMDNLVTTHPVPGDRDILLYPILHGESSADLLLGPAIHLRGQAEK